MVEERIIVASVISQKYFRKMCLFVQRSLINFDEYY